MERYIYIYARSITTLVLKISYRMSDESLLQHLEIEFSIKSSIKMEKRTSR